MLAAETIVEALAAGRLLAGHARRLRRALPQQLGVRRALEARNFHGSTESEPALRAWPEHPADADHEGPRPHRPAARLHRRPRAHEEALRAAREEARRRRPSSSTASSPSRRSTWSASAARSTRSTSRRTSSSPTRTCAATICTEEYGNPCENFCPAAVYEMMPDPEQPGTQEALHPPRELRALQDLRHRRSVPGHHLDAAAGRRRPRLHADVKFWGSPLACGSLRGKRGIASERRRASDFRVRCGSRLRSRPSRRRPASRRARRSRAGTARLRPSSIERAGFRGDQQTDAPARADRGVLGDAQTAAHARHQRRDGDRAAARASHREAAARRAAPPRRPARRRESSNAWPSRASVAGSRGACAGRAPQRPAARTASKSQPSRGNATSAAS